MAISLTRPETDDLSAKIKDIADRIDWADKGETILIGFAERSLPKLQLCAGGELDKEKHTACLTVTKNGDDDFVLKAVGRYFTNSVHVFDSENSPRQAVLGREEGNPSVPVAEINFQLGDSLVIDSNLIEKTCLIKLGSAPEEKLSVPDARKGISRRVTAVFAFLGAIAGVGGTLGVQKWIIPNIPASPPKPPIEKDSKIVSSETKKALLDELAKKKVTLSPQYLQIIKFKNVELGKDELPLDFTKGSYIISQQLPDGTTFIFSKSNVLVLQANEKTGKFFEYNKEGTAEEKKPFKVSAKSKF